MTNVKYFLMNIILMSTIHQNDSLLNNNKMMDITYTLQTKLPNVTDVAVKCFLKPICFYGEDYDFKTNGGIADKQVIMINTHDLGDIGYYVLYDLINTLYEPNLTIITNDDIYHSDTNQEMREIWNSAFNEVNIITFDERLDILSEKLNTLHFYDTRHLWIEWGEDPFSPVKPLVFISVLVYVTMIR